MNHEITIAYHLGAPFADNGMVTRSLRKNSKLLSEFGTMIQRPKTYHTLLSDMITKLSGSKATIEDQKSLLDAIVKQKDVDRLILSNPKFLGMPAWMFYRGTLYQNADNNISAIRNLFPDNPCELFLGIVNPASFISTSFKAQKSKTYEEFLDGANITTVNWSNVIMRIQKMCPKCPITVWSNEDTPIIWPTVLREIAGFDSQTRLNGELDVVQEIISPDGFDRLTKYLDEHPELTEIQRRRTRAVFLEKFFINEAVEEEIDLPGWTEETVALISENYEEDIRNIEHMPGVNFISL